MTVPQTATCSVCRTVVTVVDTAAARLKCPHCEYTLANPFAEGVSRPPASDLGVGVQSDARVAEVLVLAVGMGVTFGILIAFFESVLALAMTVVIALVAAMLYGAAMKRQRRAKEATPAIAYAVAAPLMQAIPISSTFVPDYAGLDSHDIGPSGCKILAGLLLMMGLGFLLLVGFCGYALSGLKH